jgi:hypothetical protein
MAIKQPSAYHETTTRGGAKSQRRGGASFKRRTHLDYFLIGATARDIMLIHVFGGTTDRATRDVDVLSNTPSQRARSSEPFMVRAFTAATSSEKNLANQSLYNCRSTIQVRNMPR